MQNLLTLVFLLLLPLVTLSQSDSPPLLHLSLLTDNFRHIRHENAHSHIINSSDPTPAWFLCHSTPPHSPHSSSCYIHPKHSIRLFFFFTLSPPSEIMPPSLYPSFQSTLSSLPIPSLSISDFFYSPENSRGAFSIPSPCLNSTVPNQTAVVTLTFFNHTLSLSHPCPSGPLPTFQLSPIHSLKSSHVSLRVSKPLSSAILSAVSATSSNPSQLSVLVDDPSDMDFITPLAPRQIQLFYKCHGYKPSTIDVTMRLYMPPFETHTRKWAVKCGSEQPPKGLFISTQPWLADIAAHGRILPPYNTGAVKVSSRLDLFLAYVNSQTDQKLKYSEVSMVGDGIWASLRERGIVVRKGFLKNGEQTVWRTKMECWKVGRFVAKVGIGFKGGNMVKVEVIRECGWMELEWMKWGFAGILWCMVGWIRWKMRRRGRGTIDEKVGKGM